MLSAFRFSSRACSLILSRRLAHSQTHLSRPAWSSLVAHRGVWFTSFAVVGGLYFINESVPADADTERHANTRRPTSLSTLLRSYTVYSLCSVPLLVDYSPVVLAALFSVPGLRHVTEAVVRSTFFAQFVGGDTVQDTVPLITQLRADNKGVLLTYSVEVDQGEATGKTSKLLGVSTPARHQKNVEEIIRCIDTAANFEDLRSSGGIITQGRKTWVAIKITALLPSALSLASLSDHIRRTRPEFSPPIPFPGCPRPSDLAFIELDLPTPQDLSDEDSSALRELYHNLHRIAERGAQRGVKVIIDAEHSWYQPAIDAFTLSLMRRFNKLPQQLDPQSSDAVQPMVYASFQAYLKRTPSHLQQSIQDAKAGGYSLGVKLVRGAYHPYEVDASSSPETCPVWAEKKETDACYSQCVTVLLSALRDDITHDTPRLGILFGTHNSQSCEQVLDGLVREGIAKEHGGLVYIEEAVAERCAIGQLFGMSDALTNRLVDRVRSPSPFVLKCVPYGPLSAVMPYLCRRAIENKSVLSGEGGARAERRRVGAEIRRKLLGS